MKKVFFTMLSGVLIIGLAAGVAFYNVKPALATYTYDRTITLQSSKIPANQTNFTVLVCANGTQGNGNACPTVAGLNQTGGGAHVQNSNGYDIIFSTTACTSPTLMNWEMENYVASTGEMEAWVLVPSLSSSGNIIHICYGNAAISTFQGGTVGSAWASSYTSVYHMATTTDSTINGFNLSTQGTAPTATTTGISDGAQVLPTNGNFDNLSQQFTPSSSFTFNVWVSTNWLNGGGGTGGNLIQQGTDSVNGWNAYLAISHSGSRAELSTVFGCTVTDPTTNPYSNNDWHMVTGTYNSANGSTTLFSDGSSIANCVGVNSGRGAPAGTYIGNGGDTVGFFITPADIDEAEVSNTALSSQWVTTEFNNQSNPATFETFGSETSNSTAIVTPPILTIKNSTFIIKSETIILKGN